MSTLQFADAIIDETVFLLPDVAKLTISAKNANDTNVINLNKVSTIICFSASTTDSQTDTTIAAMQKMAGALQLSFDEYILINLQEFPQFSFKEVILNKDVKRVICLGVPLSGIGLHLENHLYNSLKFNNIDIITSHSLTDITPDNKRILWARLQNMFGLK